MSDRLLLDTMLGKLATYLRMCGYDAAYALDEGVEADDEIRALAGSEDRTLLTRDETLAARTPGVVLLESREVEEQLQELADAGFDLRLSTEPVRCGVCNARLDRVDPDEDTPGYAPDPRETAIWQCPDCGQHFWKGSHWDDVAATLAELE